MDKKERNLFIFIIILLSLTLASVYYLAVKSSPPSKEDLILNKINMLENKINHISNQKDSIKTVLVTTDKQIIKNEKHYEEVVNTIINQSDSLNFSWARNYIEKFINERTQ